MIVDENGTGKTHLLKLPRPTNAANMEMPLVAEGWRKLAMLVRLIATGSLLDKGCLFWDEPESNLNLVPRSMRRRRVRRMVVLSRPVPT